jgi:acetylornithine deacetylase/succinyl-diaminopimelate desuccinylase-like protein
MNDIKEWVLTELFKFLKIKSISTESSGIKEASLYLIDLFKKIGFNTKILSINQSENPCIFAEYNINAPKTLLFYNHYDVVEADEPNWKTSPFLPIIKDNKIYARGVSDNKGNLLARIAAIKDLSPLKINIKFLIEGEEEIGSPHLASIVEKYKDLLSADLCIWEDGSKDEEGRIEVYLGCKGIVHFELQAESLQEVVHSSLGAIVENPAWRLLWAVNSLKDKDEKIKIPNFYDDVVPLTKDEISYLKNMPFNQDLKLKRLKVKNFINNLKGLELKKRLIFEPVLNINGIEAGYTKKGHKTIIPNKAICKLDFRLVPRQSPEDILKKLRNYLDKIGFSDIKITKKGGYPPAKTDINNPYVKLVIDTAKEVYNREYVIYPMLPASGPMYLFSQDMPCIGIGINHAGSNPHSCNENIYVDDLFLGISYFKRLISIFQNF